MKTLAKFYRFINLIGKQLLAAVFTIVLSAGILTAVASYWPEGPLGENPAGWLASVFDVDNTTDEQAVFKGGIKIAETGNGTAGAMRYSSSSKQVEFHDGTEWKNMQGESGGWGKQLCTDRGCKGPVINKIGNTYYYVAGTEVKTFSAGSCPGTYTQITVRRQGYANPYYSSSPSNLSGYLYRQKIYPSGTRVCAKVTFRYQTSGCSTYKYYYPYSRGQSVKSSHQWYCGCQRPNYFTCNDDECWGGTCQVCRDCNSYNFDYYSLDSVEVR